MSTQTKPFHTWAFISPAIVITTPSLEPPFLRLNPRRISREAAAAYIDWRTEIQQELNNITESNQGIRRHYVYISGLYHSQTRIPKPIR